MKRKKYIYILLLLLILTTNCVVKSKNPIDSVENAYNDKKLPGLWKHINKEEKSNSYLLVLQSNTPYYQFIFFEDRFKVEDDNFQGFISKINNDKYLNVQPLQITDGSPQIFPDDLYIFAHYKISSNKLKIQLFKKDYFEDLIANKILKGDIKSDVILNDSSENISGFIKNNDKSLFLETEILEFTKVKHLK